MAKDKSPKEMGNSSLQPLVIGPRRAEPPARSEKEGFSLLDHVARGFLSLPGKYREQRRFFRFLRRASSDRQLLAAVQQLRDNVILASVKNRKSTGGFVVALTGPRGGEGTSFLSLMLSIWLKEPWN